MPGPQGDLSGAVWCKARKSQNSADCVEVADLGDRVAVRDSKHPDGPKLFFTPREWDCFLDGARNGEFDQQR